MIYSIPNSAAAGLVWTITIDPPNNSVQFNGPPIGESVELNWYGPAGQANLIQLCATPTNPCYDPAPICMDIIPPPHFDPFMLPLPTVCEGEEVVFEWQGPPGQTYTWTSLPSGQVIGAPASGSGDLIFTAQNPTDMILFGGGHVAPWLGGCQGSEPAWSVNVRPAPYVNPLPDVTVCGGAPVAVAFSGSPGATFTWTNDNPAIGLPASGAGNINFTSLKSPQPQTATITVIAHHTLNDCTSQPVTFQITLDGTVVVDDPPNLTVCPGEPVNVNFTGTGDFYLWTNSNSFIGLSDEGTGDISFTAEGSALQQTAIVTVTPQPCPFASQTFTITTLPAAFVNQPSNVSVCGGEMVTVILTGSIGTVFNWTNSNPAIGLAASGSGSLIVFTSPNVQSTQTATVTVTPVKSGCTGEPVTFNITVAKCCATDAGTLDTNAIAVCGPKTVALALPGNHHLEPNDTIRFILYSNPNNPAGSIVQYSDTLFFPFLPGVMNFGQTYYAAVLAGPQLPNDSINSAASCFSIFKGPKVLWRPIPTIAVAMPPESVCSDGCADVVFDLTGTPPFQFTWQIVQGGQILLSKTETSATYQMTVTVCPSDFDVPGTGGYVNFSVNFLTDMFCGCGD